jgi:hypothetical protein
MLTFIVVTESQIYYRFQEPSPALSIACDAKLLNGIMYSQYAIPLMFQEVKYIVLYSFA